MKQIYCYSLSKFFKKILDSNMSDAVNILSSVDFEYFWKKGDYILKTLSHGAFGTISEMVIDDELLVDNHFKIVVVKRNKSFVSKIPVLVNDIWLVDFQMSEIYFSAFIRYLTDIKVCPYLQRYISLHIVEDEYVLFSEKYDMELMKFFPHLDSDYIMQFLFQFTYTIYILKIYLGLVHYDTHLRNLMVKKSDSSSGVLISDSYCGIYLPYMPYELRLIDFGFCTLDLNISLDNFLRRNLKIAPHNFNKKPNIPELFTTRKGETSKLLTIEIQYFCIHLYQLIHRQSSNNPMLQLIQNFCECIYQQPVDLMNPSLEGAFILRQHDVGVICNSITQPTHLIDGLKRYCEKYGQIVNYNNKQIFSYKKGLINLNSILEISPRVSKEKSKKYKYYLQHIYDLKWYEPSFFKFRHNIFGHMWAFRNFKKTNKKSDNDLVIYYKNQPYNINNAYLSVDENIVFSRNKNSSDFHSRNFYCGKFIVYNEKFIETKGKINFLIGILNDQLTIINFEISIHEHIMQFIKDYNFSILINATDILGLRIDYESKIVIDKNPLIYINLM